MKNKKLIILGSVLTVIALLLGAFALQVYRGVHIKDFSYLIKDVDQEELDFYIECYSTDEETYIYFDNEERFPSANAEDYKRIILYADICNFSILHYMRTDCFMHDYIENSSFCFAIPSNAVYCKIERFSEEPKVPIGTLLIYCADLDEKEIRNCIKNLTVDNYFTNNLCGDIKYRSNLKSENLIALSENPFS